MKDDTIIFEAAEEKNRLKLGIYKPDDVIWRYDDLPVPMARVKSRCNEIKETLNKASRNGGGARAYDKLMAVGRMLSDELLSKNIKEKLSKTDAEYLVLKLDDNLVQIPWELLCVDESFLCQRFSAGRVVKTRQEVMKNNERSMTRPLKVWIVANPRGDLRVAEKEGLGIFRDMAKMNVDDTIVEPKLDMEITPDEIRENLKAYDFVHFAGHADYNAMEPVSSGWRLAGGNFTVRDIDKMAGGSPMPALIFSNACQSARTEGWESESPPDGSFEMTNAFLRSGVRHYVGTSWEIMDEPSSYFSREFYTHLRSGKSVGEAVRQARLNLTEKFGPDICWASYLLYGDPGVRYFRDMETVGKEKKECHEPIQKEHVQTRGSIFKDAVNSSKLKEFRGCAVVLLGIVAVLIAVTLGLFASDWIKIREKGIDSEKRVEIERMLIDRADSQQERAEALFEELNALVANLPVKNGKTDATNPSIVTVFDSMMTRKGKEKILLYAIQDGIINSLENFRLLEYESFDIVLKELIRKIELTPAEKRVRPNLLMPKLVLILEIHDTGQTTLVLMRLVEKDSRRILETIFHELDNDKPVLRQKENLTKELVEKLKKHENI